MEILSVEPLTRVHRFRDNLTVIEHTECHHCEAHGIDAVQMLDGRHMCMACLSRFFIRCLTQHEGVTA